MQILPQFPVPRSVPLAGFVAAACLIGLWTSLVPLLGADGSRLPGDLIDSRFIGYVLEHGWLWLTGHEAGFWSAPFYYPMTRTLALSDNMAGALPLYALVRGLAPTPEQAMVWFLALCFGLNWAAALMMARSFGASLAASVVAAYPVVCGMTIAAQAMHPQYLLLYPVLLAFGLLGRYLLAPDAGRAAMLALGATLLALTSYYYAVFFLLMAVVAVVLQALCDRARRGAGLGALRFSPWSLATLAACLLVLACNYLPYFMESLETGPWPAAMTAGLSPSLAGLVAPPPGSFAWGWLEGLTRVGPEGHLFAGVFPLAGLACGVFLLWRRPDRPGVLAGALAVAAAAVCVLFLDIWGTASPLRHVPGLAALRVTTRVTVVALPCFAVCLALCLDRAWRSFASARRGLALVALLALVVADQYVAPRAFPSHAWAPARERVTALAARVPADAAVIYVDPGVSMDDPGYWAVHVDAMLAAQRLGKATYNGYTSWLPPVLGLFYVRDTCGSLDAWRNVAAALYRPGADRAALYADSAFLGRLQCPVDPAALEIPQGRHQSPLPAGERRADVRAVAAFDPDSRRLRVDAVVRNLGGSALYGLGDFSHRGAVFLMAGVYDGQGRRTDVPLGRLDHALGPGATLAQRGEAQLPPGLDPRRVTAFLVQSPDGAFSGPPERAAPVTVCVGCAQ